MSRVLKASQISLGVPREIRPADAACDEAAGWADLSLAAGAAAQGQHPGDGDAGGAPHAPVACAAAEDGGPAPAPAPDPLEEARREAEALLSRAREEAERVLAEGREGAARGMVAARERGLEEGRKEAMGRAQEEAAGIVARAQKVLAEAETQAQALLVRSKEDLVRVATAVAARIVRRELATRPETVVGLVAEALTGLKEERAARVRAHPGDVVMLESRRAELMRAAPGLGSLEFLGDEAMEPGGLMIEAEHGQVDARVETQLNNLAASMLEVVRNGG